MDTTPDPLNTVTWWELPVGDIPQATTFYGTVFDWTFRSFGDDDRLVGVEYGGALIGALYRADGPPPDGDAIRVYVNVADLEGTLAAARSAVGSVATPRTEIGGDMGWWAEVLAPDGRRLGLCTADAAGS